MTKQIVIKLNQERFEPLLKALEKKGMHVPKSYSELVGWCLFFTYFIALIKVPELGNRPLIDIILEKRKITLEEGLVRVIQTYNIFMKEGLEEAVKFAQAGYKELK